MNEEELAAIAANLYAAGLSDKDVAMHLDRVLMGKQPEQETSPVEAFATHAYDALTGASDIPSSSGASRGGGRPTIDPGSLENMHAVRQTLDQAEEEHPDASNIGTGFGLAAPLLAPVGDKTIRGIGKVASESGQLVKSIGKGLASQTKIGRGITRGLADFRAQTAPPSPTLHSLVEGYEAVTPPAKAPAPKVDPLEVPTYLRRAGKTAPERLAPKVEPGLVENPDVQPADVVPRSELVENPKYRGPKPPKAKTMPLSGNHTSSSGTNTMAPEVQQIIDDVRARRIGNEPINPSTGKPVTENEVQGAIDKETRVNKDVTARKQASRPQSVFAQNRQRMAERFANLSDDELQQLSQQAADRKDALADTVRELLQAELQRRAS